jgi:phosphosulfolactate synthase
MNSNPWEDAMQIPVPDRNSKPRRSGFTMVLDKGLGPAATQDLVAVGSAHIDFIKLSFGTSALYSEDLLRRKIEIINAAGIDSYPGGTLLEITVWQDTYAAFLARASDLGFSAIEVSDGTLEMSEETRNDCIQAAADAGFKVITEAGKKSPQDEIPIEMMREVIVNDLEMGALFVIIEAREGGKGIGVFDSLGEVQENEVDQIVSALDDIDKIMWEAPLKNQQQYLIHRFGTNVNLGNIAVTDVLALESLRQGLRGDTLKQALDAR